MATTGSGGKAAGSALGALFLGIMLSPTLPAPPAHAQGIFEAIFGSLMGDFDNRADEAREAETYRRRAYAPAERAGGGASGYRSERQAAAPRSTSSGAMCVRLCDGRYFPVPRAANGVSLDATKVCGGLCPAAKTQVFRGSDPAYAVAADGKRYTDLDNAFTYRERVVPDCSCTGKGPGGLAQIDIESDPTLRSGDVVATAGGLTVFKGAKSFPYKAGDFTPVDSYARLKGDLRERLTSLKIDVTATPSTPVQSLAAAEESKSAHKPRRRTRAVAQSVRNENASGSAFGDVYR